MTRRMLSCVAGLVLATALAVPAAASESVEVRSTTASA